MSRVIRMFGHVPSAEQRTAIPVHTPVAPLQDTVEEFGDSQTGALSPAELVAEAKAEAAAVLERARQEAAHILAEAQSEAKKAVEAGRQQGHDDGYQTGREQARAEAEQRLREQADIAERMVETAAELRSRLLHDLHPPLVEVAMAAIRQLLKRELTVQPADIGAVVSDVLSAVADCANVEVRVHPSDYASATESHPTWQSLKFGGWEVAVVPDPAITPGGCEIRYDGGRADGTVETKLELLQATLAQWLERGVTGYVATNGD